jgi:hypothetical protein
LTLTITYETASLRDDDGAATPPEIEVGGGGSAGPIALHAAVLEPRIGRVTLERSVVSWDAVVRSPITHNQLANVVPGVLAAYDLPDLTSALAPRPLTVRAPVDPVGKSVSQGALEEAYMVCRKAYRAPHEARLVLQAQP